MIAEYDANKALRYWSLGDYGIKKANGKSFYHIKDHVGSIRVVVDESGVEKIVEGYYPFGMQQPNRSINNSLEDSNRKFNAKIKDENLGLDWLYYGARYYDPEIAVWPGVDPIRNFPSAYAFTHNNPLMLVDDDGELPILAVMLIAGVVNGTISYIKHDGDWMFAIKDGFTGALMAGALYGSAYNGAMQIPGLTGKALTAKAEAIATKRVIIMDPIF